MDNLFSIDCEELDDLVAVLEEGEWSFRWNKPKAELVVPRKALLNRL